VLRRAAKRGGGGYCPRNCGWRWNRKRHSPARPGRRFYASPA
jgi:hypothetical protein